MNIKTFAMAAVLAVTMGSAAVADNYVTFSPGSWAVDSSWDMSQASGIGFSVGTTADYADVTLTGEVGLFDAMDDTYTVSVSTAATVTAFEMHGVEVDLGGFAGVNFADVANLDLDVRDTFYGMQASFGLETLDIRVRVALDDEDPTVEAAVVLSF